MGNFTESVVEDAALAWLESLGYAVKHGPEIAPGEFSGQAEDLLQKMQQLNSKAMCKNAYCCFEKATVSKWETVRRLLSRR
jgi:hypothetical protein